MKEGKRFYLIFTITVCISLVAFSLFHCNILDTSLNLDPYVRPSLATLLDPFSVYYTCLFLSGGRSAEIVFPAPPIFFSFCSIQFNKNLRFIIHIILQKNVVMRFIFISLQHTVYYFTSPYEDVHIATITHWCSSYLTHYTHDFYTKAVETGALFIL